MGGAQENNGWCKGKKWLQPRKPMEGVQENT